MPEVLRSKVYYMRSRLLLILPTFSPAPKTNCVHKAIRQIEQQLCRPRAKGNPFARLLRTAIKPFLEQSQSIKSIASHDYYRRIWTLAERMARHGGSERLCNLMSLETWLGMVLHALLSADPAVAPDDTVNFQKSICNHEDWYRVSRALSRPVVPDKDDISRLLVLLLNAISVWQREPTAHWDGAPTTTWLQSYLAEAHSGVYQAWDSADKVWAVYSYYGATLWEKTLAGLLGALRELVVVAIRCPPVFLPQELDEAICFNQQEQTTAIQKLLVQAAVEVKANMVSAGVDKSVCASQERRQGHARAGNTYVIVLQMC